VGAISSAGLPGLHTFLVKLDRQIMVPIRKVCLNRHKTPNQEDPCEISDRRR
jgi:hypothetical protein